MYFKSAFQEKIDFEINEFLEPVGLARARHGLRYMSGISDNLENF